MADRNYTVKITHSTRELSPKEKVMYKDTSDSIKLDAATQGGEVVLKIADVITLSVHNEKATDDKDYNVYLYIDSEGNKYTSGSENLYNTIMDIFEDMEDATEEWAVRIFRLPSKNYVGRDFMTATVI